MTLCRFGKSENKPFCTGAHAADPQFRDGLV
jgi:CDGSH-type Zn-finger protein